MIDYFMALHPVIKYLMGFSVLGILSLVLIFADVKMHPPLKTYTIKVTEEELAYLEYDYSMVEAFVEIVLKQAKEQGYKPPSES